MNATIIRERVGALGNDDGFDVIVPMRNESAKLPGFVAMLRAQTLQPANLIVADGLSTDGSRETLLSLAGGLPHMTILDNKDKVVPAALNLCLQHVRSPIVARMDTHAAYDTDYLEKVVGRLREDVHLDGVGGAMRTAGHGPWGRAIASTLKRSFGLGGARHRVGGEAGPIGHVFSGCYRTASLRAVGGWDERLHANEDFEADTRLLESGGMLWLEPQAASTWFVRESPRALVVQMWRYGYYKGFTLNLHPRSLRLRQMAPPALVAAFVVGARVAPKPTLVLGGIYATVASTLGARAAGQDGAEMWRGAVVPPLVHLSWGAGALVGLVRFFRARPMDAVTIEDSGSRG